MGNRSPTKLDCVVTSPRTTTNRTKEACTQSIAIAIATHGRGVDTTGVGEIETGAAIGDAVCASGDAARAAAADGGTLGATAGPPTTGALHEPQTIAATISGTRIDWDATGHTARSRPSCSWPAAPLERPSLLTTESPVQQRDG